LQGFQFRLRNITINSEIDVLFFNMMLLYRVFQCMYD
jgi:hypothetical protein